jgi:hypothetical protein
LDTHVLLWSLADRARLTPRVQHLLDDMENELLFSTASLWEVSIKIAKGNLAVPGGSIRAVYQQLDVLRIEVLPIEFRHHPSGSPATSSRRSVRSHACRSSTGRRTDAPISRSKDRRLCCYRHLELAGYVQCHTSAHPCSMCSERINAIRSSNFHSLYRNTIGFCPA